MFVLFYVTAVCGLPAGLAGVALGAGLLVDAVMDPFIGSLSDGLRSRLGRRVPFMIGGLVPVVVTFNLMFALPSTLGDTPLFLWLMVVSVALRVSLSLFALPYQALGAELSDDYAERSSIAAWRWGSASSARRRSSCSATACFWAVPAACRTAPPTCR